MISYLSVENASSFSTIDILLDENKKFSDILRGTATKFVPVESGSVNLEITNNMGKTIFDVWLAFKPNEKYKIIVYDDTLSVR